MKRIDSSQLQRGMYIEAIEGSDVSSAMPRARFLLKTLSEVEQLRQCGANHFIINLSKGLGPAPATFDNARAVQAAQAVITASAAALKNTFDGLLAGGTIDTKDIQPVVSMVSRSLDENPSVLLNVSRLKSKDEVTFQHSISVSTLMMLFSRYLGYQETKVEEIGAAGLLHDVGKIEIDDSVLNKPGKLNDDEMQLVRSHAQRGYDILLRQNGVTPLMLDVCLNHHEKIDGSGYPNRLAHKQISSVARLAAICDVYDAVTTVRPYKEPWTPAKALKWMLGTSGHFDPKLLRKFVICMSTALQ